MSFDYDKSAATALRLLQKFGQAVTLRKQTAGAYDPATGAATVTTSDYSATGVFLDYKLQNSGQALENSMVQVGDKKLLLSPDVTSAPDVDDLIIGQGTWRIVNIKAVNPSGTPVLYELQLRK